MICNFVQSTSYHSAVKLRSIIKFSKRFFATLASNLIGYLSLYYTALPLFSLSAASYLCSVWAELDEQAVNKVLRTVIWVLSKRDQAESSRLIYVDFKDRDCWSVRMSSSKMLREEAEDGNIYWSTGLEVTRSELKWENLVGWWCEWMGVDQNSKLKCDKLEVWNLICVYKTKLLTSVDYIWTHRSLY